METPKVMSGILILQILGLWHDNLKGMSFPEETRLIQRACGDFFIDNYFTAHETTPEAFGYQPQPGHGLYYYVRDHGERLARYMPLNGYNKTKDFPIGRFFKCYILIIRKKNF